MNSIPRLIVKVELLLLFFMIVAIFSAIWQLFALVSVVAFLATIVDKQARYIDVQHEEERLIIIESGLNEIYDSVNEVKTDISMLHTTMPHTVIATLDAMKSTADEDGAE